MSMEQEMRDLLKASLAKVKELKVQLAVAEGARSEPVAVIGMGCRFPGGANDPEAFWQLLEDGKDAVSPLGPRWALAGVHPAAGVPRWGALMDVALEDFDAAFFGISPREARSLDPQHRLTIEVAWEALEHACVPPHALHASRTGVFLGAYTADYLDLVERAPGAERDVYGVTGNLRSVLAGRLSYSLGLQGPCLTIDTACSSSLVAVHLACRSLRDRESDLALAGGVNVMLSPRMMESVARTQALAPDGRCKTFDASADGFVRGEGCGLVVLKRLSDAERDGDRIWAVIRGSAVNQDGRSTGLTAPNVLAQEALLRDALAQARLAPAAVGYVETHGTGTSLGDPIEVEALRLVMGSVRPDGSKCVLGAVKTNLGHLEAASGIAGLIKAVLALHHERIPKNLHLSTVNPRLRLDGTSLALAREPVPWPRGASPRVAGVSSFGISGTNAHVVIEEPKPAAEAPPARPRSAELVVLSAKSEAALATAAARLGEHLAAHPEPALGEVAFTLATARSPMEYRLSLVASSREELREALPVAARGEAPAGSSRSHAESGSRPRVAFVFPGQGSQWLGMGRQLLAEESVFRETILACDRAIQAEAGWSLLAEIQADEASSRLARIDVVQPALFAIEVALAALWRSWGVEPDVVIGHSMGEAAAAHVAGALSLADAVKVICRRSRILARISGQGEMAVVELGIAEAEAELRGREDRLSVAVNNSPRSTVISGDPAALAEVLAALEAREIFGRRIKVDVASHSPQVEPLRADLLAALRDLRPAEASVPMRSTVTGALVAGTELGAGYWMDNLRRPVRFGDVVKGLFDEGTTLFLEMSPHPILTVSVEEVRAAAGKTGAALGSLRRDRDERRAMLESLGAVWAHGRDAAWSALFPARARRVLLPSYPWQRERCWVEAPRAQGTRRLTARAHAGGHPLLGARQTLSTAAGTSLWEATVDLARLPYLRDHRVRGDVVFPATGYLEMALAAGAESLGGDVIAGDVDFVELLSIPDAAPVEVQVVIAEEPRGGSRFHVASRASGAEATAWTVHARGTLRRASPEDAADGLDLSEARARLGEVVPGTTVYNDLRARGLEYGPAFQGLRDLRRRGAEALGCVHLPEAAGPAEGYHAHPALLDACLQVAAGSLDEGGGAAWLPVHVGAFRAFRRPEGDLWCHVRSAQTGARAPADRRSIDVLVVDRAGRPVAQVSSLTVQRLAGAADHRAEDDWFLEMTWERAPVPTAAQGKGAWLLLGDGGGLGAALRRAIEAAGQTVVHAAAGRSEELPAGCLPLDDTSAGGVRALLGRAFDGKAPSAVVHLRSLESESALSSAGIEASFARGYDSALSVTQALAATSFEHAPRLVLVTRGALPVETSAVSPIHAPLVGLARVLRLEHPELESTLIDLDPTRPGHEVDLLAAELLAGSDEREVALRGDGRFVARLAPSRPAEPRPERREPAAGRAFHLTIDTPGMLDDLVLRATPRRPPGPGEVEIAVEAAGVNFRDVLLAMGVIPDETRDGDSPVQLGGECAGRVTALGEGVEGLALGQPVLAITFGAFASHVTAPVTLVVPRSERLSAEQAASVPIAFLTAWYALDKVARLRRGERVLIHSATGGVGLAAVQWAKLAGAEIYATAGTPEKRALLHDLGVRFVSDSRSDRFAHDIHEWTGGEGVDVVLNSLSGDLIDKSLLLLRPHGRFVELGKRDYYAGRALPSRPFLRNLSFSLVDLAGMSLERPELARELLLELLGFFDRGQLTPSPFETFPVSRAPDAFRKMAQGKHVGKLVLTISNSPVHIQVPAGPRPLARPDASYLLTGGLGGLGLSLARRLASEGAGHIVLAGRNTSLSPEQQATIDDLRRSGARVSVARADVADPHSLRAVLQSIHDSGLPLRGVAHLAAVLDDGVLSRQTPARFRAVMAPKILGAWHLHELTRDIPLDFFVLYSSLAALLGNPGQANYAAANSFLDALAHHRRAAGSTALSVNWGAFSGVGLAAADDLRGARLSARGLHSLTPEQGLDALSRLLHADVAQAAVVRLDPRKWAEQHPALVRSPLYTKLLAERTPSAARGDDAASLLTGAAPGERAALLSALIRREVVRVLRLAESTFDTGAPLVRLGLDSLMGLELKHALKRATNIDVPVPRMLSGMTTADVVHYLNREAPAPSGGTTTKAEETTWLDTEL